MRDLPEGLQIDVSEYDTEIRRPWCPKTGVRHPRGPSKPDLTERDTKGHTDREHRTPRETEERRRERQKESGKGRKDSCRIDGGRKGK